MLNFINNVGTSALNCYECHYYGKTADGDNQCKDGGDIFGESGMETTACPEGYNVCIFNYSSKFSYPCIMYLSHIVCLGLINS